MVLALSLAQSLSVESRLFAFSVYVEPKAEVRLKLYLMSAVKTIVRPPCRGLKPTHPGGIKYDVKFELSSQFLSPTSSPRLSETTLTQFYPPPVL